MLPPLRGGHEAALLPPILWATSLVGVVAQASGALGHAAGTTAGFVVASSFLSGPLSRVGVPQGVRETSRLAAGGGLTAAAMEPPAVRGLSHGVPHRSPWRALATASLWAGDCSGVRTSTAVAATTSGLRLLAGTGLFPGESTSIAVSEAALPVRTGRR